MRRSLALLALVVLAAGGLATADAKPGHQLYGIVGDNGNAQLATLHPETLIPLNPYGPRIRLRTASGWGFSPDKNYLAIATGMPPAGARTQPAALRVIDLRSMRRLMNVRLGPDPRATGNFSPVGAVAWLRETRIVLLYGRGDGDTELVVVDTTARRIVRRMPLVGTVLDHATTTRELLLLVGRAEEITTPRLIAVDARGEQRSVTLGAIRAGSINTGAGAETVHHSIDPAFTVDTASRKAYVVEPSGMVASVALDTMSVSYRAVTGRYAKLWDGASRVAVVVRPGLLAIAGTESTVTVDPARGPRTLSRPAGLEMLDTTTTPWTPTRMEPQASHVATWGGNLIVTGRWPHPQLDDEQLGIGLAMYGPDGRQRFRVLDGRAVYVVGTFLGRAYVYLAPSGERAIVDLETGEVRGRRLGDFPWLLLDPRGAP